MKIIKKLNNNVVQAINDENQEVVLFGKGLGFHNIPYILKNEKNIEKIYIKQNDTLNILSEIYKFPENIVNCCQEIIIEAEKILRYNYSINLLLSLSDHLTYALERANYK